MASHLKVNKPDRNGDIQLRSSSDPIARIESALRSFDGRVPAAGSELHAAIAEQVRLQRDGGSPPGPILIDLNRTVTTVVGYSAGAHARRAGLDALLEQVVRWALDAYYRAD